MPGYGVWPGREQATVGAVYHRHGGARQPWCWVRDPTVQSTAPEQAVYHRFSNPGPNWVFPTLPHTLGSQVLPAALSSLPLPSELATMWPFITPGLCTSRTPENPGASGVLSMGRGPARSLGGGLGARGLNGREGPGSAHVVGVLNPLCSLPLRISLCTCPRSASPVASLKLRPLGDAL